MKIIPSIDQFNQVIQSGLVIILAKTHSCGVCTAVASQLDQMLQSYSNIPFYHLYVDDLIEFSGQHLVFTVPTVLVFGKGVEIARESRFIRYDKLKRVLEYYQEERE